MGQNLPFYQQGISKFCIKENGRGKQTDNLRSADQKATLSQAFLKMHTSAQTKYTLVPQVA